MRRQNSVQAIREGSTSLQLHSVPALHTNRILTPQKSYRTPISLSILLSKFTLATTSSIVSMRSTTSDVNDFCRTCTRPLVLKYPCVKSRLSSCPACCYHIPTRSCTFAATAKLQQYAREHYIPLPDAPHRSRSTERFLFRYATFIANRSISTSYCAVKMAVDTAVPPCHDGVISTRVVVNRWR